MGYYEINLLEGLSFCELCNYYSTIDYFNLDEL